MKKNNLCILLILTGYSVLAQTDYIVTLKADTLKGETRILSYDQLDRVQISQNGKKEGFTALQVLIVCIDNELYKSVKLDNSIRLMKIIKSGYLSLYAFKLTNQSSFDGRYLVRLDGTFMELPNIGFKKIMAGYLEDCEELSEKIKKGEIGKGKIEEIVDQYNECLTKQKPAVIPQPVVAPLPAQNTIQLEAIQNLMNKINAENFTTKEDALDILRDIQSKVGRNESVSNYLVEGLKSTLKDQEALSAELNQVVESLKK